MAKRLKGTELELEKLKYSINKNQHGYFWHNRENDSEGDNIWETKEEAMTECIDDNELDICYPD